MLAVVATAIVIARCAWGMPIGREIVGPEISDVGLVIQLLAVVVGVVVIHSVAGARARWAVVAQGAVCLLAHGVLGLVFGLGLLAWWASVNALWLGRARFVVAVALFAGVAACGTAGLMFSMLFAMRLAVFVYDRWQHDEPTPLLDFLVYVLPAPLVIAAPYLAIIPLFGGFGAKLQPGLTRARLGAIMLHFAWAAGFGALRGAMELASVTAQPLAAYWHLLAAILELATFAHILIPLLALHGIEERMPLDRPLASTRFTELWRRFGVHLRDAQMFLFYTPALLRLRRANRYLAIVLATAWTMIVGNTLLHVVVRYCFLADTTARIGWALLANSIMTVALAAELCHDEWWIRRGGRPPRTLPRLVFGWFATMTVAATVVTL